ncbi:MAG: cupin domain-containing protein [Gammaproteobacteria bacterium]|nr:MAG: cupin domain-containing protein [Gammaproteobacteria bacterium]
MASNSPVTVGNLFSNIPVITMDELFEDVIVTDFTRIQRIISRGQSSPEGFWYDQPENELIVIMQGRGKLEFDNGEYMTMEVGDYIAIPAHRKHRVAWTDPNIETIWLAVFY